VEKKQKEKTEDGKKENVKEKEDENKGEVLEIHSFIAFVQVCI
jgi:cbb3-type cytochrome oxidase cytochrome c subunit